MLPWHETSMYDHPEDFGLKLVSEVYINTIDGYCPGGFDTVAIWRTKDNRYLIGNDVGCGCSIPFENTRADQLTEITTFDELKTFVQDVWQTRPAYEIIGDYSTLAEGVIFG